MNRITIKDLNIAVERLNEALNMPMEYSTQSDTFKANVGHYTIDRAYGGFSLYQVANASGGVHDIFHCGHVSARDLFNRLHAMIEGVNAGVRHASI